LRERCIVVSPLPASSAALASASSFAYEPRLYQNRPAVRAAVAVLFAHSDANGSSRLGIFQKGDKPQESQMPKMKTKSGAKKRFKITGTGKVVYAQAGKRHGMIKRTTKQIRNLRGTAVLFKTDGDNIKKYFLPNG
jgi:large subunit ribosomal protein L35